MPDNRSRLKSQETLWTSAATIQCEVLRGAFLDAHGQMHHGKVHLPSEQAVSAKTAVATGVLLTTEHGVVLDVLDGRFPALAMLRVSMSPLHPVTAAAVPEARYDTLEIKTFAMLLDSLRRAIRDADAVLVGQVATASARIRQRCLPKPHFDILLNVTVSFGACGLGVSPVGSDAALIFDPEKRDVYWSMQGAARALRELGICRTRHLARPGAAACWRSV